MRFLSIRLLIQLPRLYWRFLHADDPDEFKKLSNLLSRMVGLESIKKWIISNRNDDYPSWAGTSMTIMDLMRTNTDKKRRERKLIIDIQEYIVWSKKDHGETATTLLDSDFFDPLKERTIAKDTVTLAFVRKNELFESPDKRSRDRKSPSGRSPRRTRVRTIIFKDNHRFNDSSGLLCISCKWEAKYAMLKSSFSERHRNDDGTIPEKYISDKYFCSEGCQEHYHCPNEAIKPRYLY